MRLTGPGSVLDRVLRLRPVVIVRRTLEVYGFGGGILAAGLAYRSLFALLSASLLIAGVVGFIVRDPARQAEIIDAVGQRFPPIAPLLKTGLDGVASGAVQFSIIGLAGLAWGVSGVYGTLDIAIARLYGSEEGHGLAIRTIRGLVLVGVLILGIIFAAIATTLSLTVDVLSGPGTPSVLQTVVGILSPVASVAVYVGVVALVYRFVPPTPPSWRALGAAGDRDRRHVRRLQHGVRPPAVVPARLVPALRGFRGRPRHDDLAVDRLPDPAHRGVVDPRTGGAVEAEVDAAGDRAGSDRPRGDTACDHDDPANGHVAACDRDDPATAGRG